MSRPRDGTAPALARDASRVIHVATEGLRTSGGPARRIEPFEEDVAERVRRRDFSSHVTGARPFGGPSGAAHDALGGEKSVLHRPDALGTLGRFESLHPFILAGDRPREAPTFSRGSTAAAPSCAQRLFSSLPLPQPLPRWSSGL